MDGWLIAGDMFGFDDLLSHLIEGLDDRGVVTRTGDGKGLFDGGNEFGIAKGIERSTYGLDDLRELRANLRVGFGLVGPASAHIGVGLSEFGGGVALHLGIGLD